MIDRFCLSIAILALVAAPALAQRELKQIPDPDPELERKSFILPEGFEINLFAADPLLAKPIQMNFDARGRLWVACSEVYPQIQPGQKANDKIIVLEDADGDGRAEKTTVFADGLLIPTGVEPGDGGAYVADSTDLVHLADTKGTGRADKRRVLLSGFGTEDTHHILHTLRWGPDGQLYFNQSIYIHSHIETPHGVRRLGGGGIWQYRPESEKLEVFARGWVNSWGHHHDRFGQSFATDGAYGEGINYAFPGAAFVAAVGVSRIMEGLNPGSPKHCGLEIISGRHLPPDWQGNMVTNDFRGHRVCRFVISEDGSGYSSREQTELVKTNHPAFRPIDVKMGPDGAIYIADWYNPIIQHGEVDFRDPRRDHTHGRIWRVTAKGRPLVPRPNLVNATTPALLDHLKAPEDWTRHQTKRVLKERGAGIVPDLAAWVKRQPGDSAESEHDLLEALWVYQGLDIVEPNLLMKLLHAKDGRVRAAAVRVLSAWQAKTPKNPDFLAELVKDAHPRVRLEAVRALALVPSIHSAELALSCLEHPVDRPLDYAIWLTARELAPQWLPAVQTGDFDFRGKLGQLTYALEALGSAEAVRPLVKLVEAGKIPVDRQAGVLGLVARIGGANELGLVFDWLIGHPDVPPSIRVDLLNTLRQTAERRKLKPSGDVGRLQGLLEAGPIDLRAAAIRLAGSWKIESLREAIAGLARSGGKNTALSQAAIAAIGELGGPESQKMLEGLIESTKDLELIRHALVALVAVDQNAAARRGLDYCSLEGADATEVFSAILQRKGGDTALSRALANRQLGTEAAKLGIRSVRLSGRESPALIAAFTKAGNIGPTNRNLTPEQMRALVAEISRKGDAARGELVFRRKDLGCLKCHAIAGAGGLVGPDLVSVGASAPVDYLVESLYLPNKAIKENYNTMVVSTKDGRVLTGIKVRQTDRDLVLRDAEDREVTIPNGSIEEKANGNSLMPDGLTDSLTHGELLDLVRFLSELGKVGPFAVGKAPLLRTWQVLEPNREAYQLLSRTSFAAAAEGGANLAWQPLYSKVDGQVPLADLPHFEFKKGFTNESQSVSFMRGQFEVSTPGKLRLVLNSLEGIQAWIDREPVDTKADTTTSLNAGMHTLTLAIRREQRKDGVRCSVEEIAGGTARARPINGK